MPDPEIPDAQDLHDTLSAAFDAPSSDPAVDTVAPPEDASLAGKEGEQPRGPDGKFVAKPEAAEPPADAKPSTEQKPAEVAVATPPAKSSETTPPVSASPTVPPPGWSVAAKAEWDNLPPAIRDAVAKRETEISTGLARLGDYKGLESHVDLARQHGTTIAAALDRYVGLERALTANPIPALRSICSDIGLDERQLVSAIMGPTTAAVPGDQKPGEQRPAEQQPSRPDPAVADLQRRLEQLATSINGERQSAVQSELAAFAGKPEHKYFENVRARMGALMSAPGGPQNLADAYEMACWADPEIRAALISERAQKDRENAERERTEAASKAAIAARSVNGSPGGASVPGVPDRGLREEISANFE